jgi:DNA adenine methylase
MRNVYEGTPPPLKWAGGKRWLVPLVQQVWDAYQDRRYVEPFAGGIALPLALRPAHALLNDNNLHLINFYQHMQAGLVIEMPMDNDRDQYYHYREQFNALIAQQSAQSAAAAMYFYYLNRTGFNGLCRFNRSGYFNVPFGKYKTIPFVRDFLPYRPIMDGWQFSAFDFEQLTLNSRDFVYADPPYDVEFVQYSQFGFSWNDQERLAHWLQAHAGPVIASNQATARILALYEQLGFEIVLRPAPRRISANGNRQPALEMIAFRNVRGDLFHAS